MMNYTVLMSVYKNDNAVHFQESIDSILNQTIASEQFVIVRDGPVPKPIQTILDESVKKRPELYTIIELDENVGLAKALSIGCEKCRNELVFRQDADDISLPQRAETQLPYFSDQPNLGLLSSSVDLYDYTMKTKLTSRDVPKDHEDIVRFSKYKTPFNHSVAVFRKSSADSCGGYENINGQFEDWFFSLRMIKAGYKLFNVQQTLVYVRGGENFFKRRRGIRYAKDEISNQLHMYKDSLLPLSAIVINLAIRIPIRLLPGNLVSWIYLRFIRK